MQMLRMILGTTETEGPSVSVGMFDAGGTSAPKHVPRLLTLDFDEDRTTDHGIWGTNYNEFPIPFTMARPCDAEGFAGAIGSVSTVLGAVHRLRQDLLPAPGGSPESQFP
jgi:hypothetical protein